jgi:hypothetical protein
MCLGCCATAFAASPPSEELFPSATKGWVSVPNVDTLRENFKLTQLGELVNDPTMKPFMEDLSQQLEEKLNDAGVKLGLKFSDLDGVYGGEVASGMVRPDPKDANSHALALVVDITGKHQEANELLVKIDKNMAAKGARKTAKRAGAITLTYYTLPKKPEEKVPTTAIYAIQGDTLVASDNESVLVGILGRIPGKAKDSLATVEAFHHIKTKVFGKNDPMASHARWFVEPLGYAEVARAANGGKTKRGADKLAILRKQGFGALQGVGGRVEFHTPDHEILHHSYVYAPPVKDAKPGEKYHRAANMLDFPNSANLDVQAWVPKDVSSYITLSWKMQKAFDYFGSIFDAFTEEGTWEEILAGLEQDPAGPEINIKDELVKNVAQRLTLITDYRLPIDPKSERVVVGIELDTGIKDVEKKALAAVRKLMKAEPDARKIEIEGYEVWEVAERVEEAEVPMLNIDGPGFVAFEGSTVAEKEGEAVAALAPAGEKPISWAITVAEGHIFVGTHVDFLAAVLKKKAPAEQLAGADDLKEVRATLTKLGSDKDSFRFFTRTDEAYRPTYELLQKGLMPQAETMLGRLLNSAFAPQKKGEVRKQEIDGRKLPPFAKVADYFGPAGAFVQSEDEGWLVKGCLLKKVAQNGEKKPAEVAEQIK